MDKKVSLESKLEDFEGIGYEIGVELLEKSKTLNFDFDSKESEGKRFYLHIDIIESRNKNLQIKFRKGSAVDIIISFGKEIFVIEKDVFINTFWDFVEEFSTKLAKYFDGELSEEEIIKYFKKLSEKSYSSGLSKLEDKIRKFSLC